MKLSTGVLALLVVTRGAASAERAAERLFLDGRAFAKAGKLAEACDAFERSDQLEPRVGTLLNLADCREKQGRITTAYALFLEASVRALFTLEPRATFASQRATDLAAVLPSLTVKIARSEGGLVIKRGDTVIPAEDWNMPTPLDPGTYTIEATAPDRATWSITRTLNPGDRITVTVGPLEAVAAPRSVPSVRPAPPHVATATEVSVAMPAAAVAESAARPASKPHRHLAVGAALGVSLGKVSSAPSSDESVLQDDHLPVGVRLVGSIGVPNGALRAIGSLLYTKGLNDKTDPTNTKKLYVLGIGADYVYLPRAKLGFAVGVGVGWDYEVRAYGQGTDLAQTIALRASPIIYRVVEGKVELGVHTQLVRRGDGVGFVGLAAVDVFLL